MTTIDATLRRSLETSGRDLILTLDPALQGLPETAHGGSVLAVFDAVAEASGPREVSGVYRRRVPVGTPLTLVRARADSTDTFVLSDCAGSVLVDGRVVPLAADVGRPGVRQGSKGPVPANEATDVASPDGAQPPRGSGRMPRGPSTPAAPPDGPHPLPVSRTCFACGTDNELGLRVRLEFDAATVQATWQPRAPFRRVDGTLASAGLTTLLDETAFWLGALATGESGMTTDLRVSLHRPAPFDARVTVTGARAAVRPRADDPRYWETDVVACADGEVVATARITFVVMRGAARRLVAGMLAINDPAWVRRVFPAYTR